MTVVDVLHPVFFKTGVRVLTLTTRNKDLPETKLSISLVSYDPVEFDRQYSFLREQLSRGFRIYASLGDRCILKAIRLFKERQLASEYDRDYSKFYRNIDKAWVSALMSPRCENEKFWLFDCDSLADYETVQADIKLHYDKPFVPYSYATKNGHHVVVQPFDKRKCTDLSKSLIHDNSQMLWAFS
jgi:hypothetical protein